MFDIQLPPALADLCTCCETICQKECCGIEAFSFSPFNIIYHLTRVNAFICDTDIAKIRAELADLVASLRSLDHRTEKLVLPELNAILSPRQLIAVIGEINSALSEACVIHDSHRDQLEKRQQAFSRIIKEP